MLDARNPAAGSSTTSMRDLAREDEERDDAIRREVERLRLETRAWRGVNSAQWVMWGVVQARIPGLPDFNGDDDGAAAPNEGSKAVDDEGQLEEEQAEEEEEEEDGFDYLNYSRERALFFWGDLLALGIMKASELPATLVDEARVLDY
jgi:choline kinase